ncbi:MAG: BrnT family toxin [Caulobacteraceae bacterium]
MDGFEWHTEKAAANVAKHGIGFQDAAIAMMGLSVIDRSERGDENRFRSICRLRDELIVVVWTPRPNAIRIISARRAKRHERERYRQGLREGSEGRRF